MLFFPFLDVSVMRPRPNDNRSAPRPVSIPDPLRTANESPRREIGPLNDFHQLINGNLRIVNHGNNSVADLIYVMRRNARGHSNRNTGASVTQQIGKFRRKDDRFRPGIIIVGHIINGLPLQIFHNNHRCFSHAGLGVTHCRRRVAINGAKVPLPLNQRIPVIKILSHADEGGVNHLFSVWMVIAGGIACNLGAFPEFGTGTKDRDRSWLPGCAAVKASARPLHREAHGS